MSRLADKHVLRSWVLPLSRTAIAPAMFFSTTASSALPPRDSTVFAGDAPGSERGGGGETRAHLFVVRLGGAGGHSHFVVRQGHIFCFVFYFLEVIPKAGFGSRHVLGFVVTLNILSINSPFSSGDSIAVGLYNFFPNSELSEISPLGGLFHYSRWVGPSQRSSAATVASRSQQWPPSGLVFTFSYNRSG